ncbi:MAG: hypothetical protein RLZZ196_1555 [Bacteroidota bacterium]|jgi:AraC-like DNA-binding protein
MKRTFVEPEEIQEWIKLNNEYTVNEIAKKTGRNRKTIDRYFKEIGYKPNNYFPRIYHEKFTEEEIVKMHQIYMQNPNYSLTQLAKDNGVSSQNLDKRFRKLGLKTKNHYTVAHKQINDNFFENIDTEEKAYLLGFFAADGHIENRVDCNTYCLKVNVSSKDREVLEMFNKHVANNLCKIRKRSETTVEIAIHSKQIGKDLKKLGYDNRKTYTCNHLPQLPKNMMRHFIRGYFDGDGSIICNKNKKNTNRRMSISAYKDVVLKEILSHLPYINKVYWKYTEQEERLIAGQMSVFTGVRFDIADKASLGKIFKYFYKDSSLYLTRKFNKFREAVS